MSESVPLFHLAQFGFHKRSGVQDAATVKLSKKLKGQLVLCLIIAIEFLGNLDTEVSADLLDSYR